MELEELLAGDPALLNLYHALVLDPAWYPNANITAGRAFAAFLLRLDVQQIIEEFGVTEFGEPIFVPEAGKPEPFR